MFMLMTPDFRPRTAANIARRVERESISPRHGCDDGLLDELFSNDGHRLDLYEVDEERLAEDLDLGPELELGSSVLAAR
jgi:hypothetical protein